MILFLFFSVVLLFLVHFFVYFSINHFFAIQNPTVRRTLLILLAFLMISFILSSLLSHWQENGLTRAYYIVSGLWLGSLTYIFLALVAAWAFSGLTRLAGLNAPAPIVAAGFLFLAFVLTGYGIWNAKNIRVKEIEVTIENLPEFWEGRKIAHISDIHLGQINRAAFMRQIVEKLNQADPEMVLITGDLFDGMDGDMDNPIRPLNDLAAPRGTFFVNGNHETYLGLEHVLKALKKTKVRVLNDEVADIQGLKLIGLGYPERMDDKDIIGTLRGLKPSYAGKPNVLMYHAPVKIEEIAREGIDLELCGHTHKGQLFPFNFITRAVYGGYDHGFYRLEKYALYTSSGAGTWGPAMRVGSRSEIVLIKLSSQK